MDAIAPGAMIGPYRLDAPLGEGGMGIVYRAADTRLNRPVAIKFLSTDLADVAARRRFQREAQLASSLNHPHILTVHDAGELDGRQYLVTELVDGGTLRDWIKAGPRTWQDVVELLVGVADGLATAHEAGIMHRDIKPANILITKSGYTKLADFGLAKLSESHSAITKTLAEGRTRTGAIVGTPAYMSPEQASGQPIDARSDVFSFAVVLYEMLAGQRPAAGATALPASIPRPLRALIQKSLEQNPDNRTPTMRELVVELRRLVRHTGETTAPREWHRGIALKLTAGLALLALVVVTAVVMLRRVPAPAAAVSTQYIQLTNFADSATSPALSQDGRLLAFIRGPGTLFSTGQIWVKPLPDGDPLQLTSDDVRKMGPRFTPDGKLISYTTGGSLVTDSMDTWVVPAGGGEPRQLLANAEGLTWFKDHSGGARVLFSEMTGVGGQMSIVSSSETRTSPLNIYAPPPPYSMAHRSYLSPDRASVLIVEMDLYSWLPCRVVPFDRSSTGKVVGPVPSLCTDAAWSPDGSWMYFTADTGSGPHLWRQRFPDGTPQQITFSAVSEEGIEFAPDGRSFITSIGTSQSTLWLHDSHGDRQITQEGYAFQPSLSPDGQKVYYLVRSFGKRSWNQGELWVAELNTGQRRRLLAGLQISYFSISADGRRVVFTRVGDDGHCPVWLADLDGEASLRQVTPMDAGLVFFGAPGQVIFAGNAAEDLYVYGINEDGRDLQKLIPIPLIPLSVSPDGRWIAVQDPRAWGALIVYPSNGGAPIRLCEHCAPPWGPDPVPFFLGWTADGKFLQWTFADSTYAIPLSNAALPAIPAGGLQSKDAVAALPGARLIAQQTGFFPGPNPSLYAFTKVSTQRNIYRVPVP